MSLTTAAPQLLAGHGLVGGHALAGHGVVGGVHGGLGHAVAVRPAVHAVSHAVAHPVEVYPDEISPFTYNYAVADDYSGSRFTAVESDDGTGVRDGSYSVDLPDGRTQHVNYHTNDLDGYVAQVSYDGAAAHAVAAPLVRTVAHPVAHAVTPALTHGLVGGHGLVRGHGLVGGHGIVGGRGLVGGHGIIG